MSSDYTLAYGENVDSPSYTVMGWNGWAKMWVFDEPHFVAPDHDDRTWGPVFLWTPTIEGLYNFEYTRDNPEALDNTSWHLDLPDSIIADIRRSIQKPIASPARTATSSAIVRLSGRPAAPPGAWSVRARNCVESTPCATAPTWTG